MPFQTWLTTQSRGETSDAPFRSAAFTLGPNDGYVVFHLLPQGVLGTSGQQIEWWLEARKTGATEYQRVAGATIDCSLDPTTSKSGYFGGEVSLYGEEYDSIRGCYYTINGPVTFGAEGDIRPALRARRR